MSCVFLLFTFGLGGTGLKRKRFFSCQFFPAGPYRIGRRSNQRVVRRLETLLRQNRGMSIDVIRQQEQKLKNVQLFPSVCQAWRKDWFGGGQSVCRTEQDGSVFWFEKKLFLNWYFFSEANSFEEKWLSVRRSIWNFISLFYCFISNWILIMIDSDTRTKLIS